jgi:amidase
MSGELWRFSAVEMAKLLRERAVTPLEVLDSLAARIDAANPSVNALPTLCLDRARQAALRDGLSTTVLGGLPIPIKDSYRVEGVRTTWGSLAFEHHVPECSDYLVEAIEGSGGIVYAKSNTPEFEAGANTFNEVFGRTLNPWDMRLSAAGSSGGAAAAVATGMAFIAQGSDFACSLRYPAAFCGVAGLRPTPGIIPQGPSPLPWQSLSVIGPLARTVADLGLGLQAMSRRDARDPLSRACDGAGYAQAAAQPKRPARLAWSRNLGVATVDRVVLDAVESAVARIAGEGVAVAEAHPDLRASDAAFRPLRAFQFAAMRADLIDGPARSLLKPEVVWNIEEGLRLSARELAAAEAQRATLRDGMLAFLDRHDFLFAPTAPVPPFPVEQRYVARIGETDLATYLDWLVLGYAITVSGCPAISIPCGFTPGGLPLGLQIVAAPWREAELLSVAAWCEEVLGASLVEPIDPRPAAVPRKPVDSTKLL